MWPYWLLFLVPAFLAMSKLRQVPLSPNERWSPMWRGIFVFLVLMIGLRHEVGGDWLNYLEHIEAAASEKLAETFFRGDPAFAFLNWFSAKSGFGVYLINSSFAVAMGYSRQGVAIGLVMLGLLALQHKSILKFLLWIALAAAFHKSAVILLPIAVLADTRRKFVSLIWIGITTVLLFYLLLLESVAGLKANYIDAEYESSGAAIRVTMNILPALIFLLLRKRFQLLPFERSFWTWMAWGALAFAVLLYFSPSSTAVDRVALYWIPLQLFRWSRVPDAMGRPGSANAFWVCAVVGYSAAVYFVWLFFATNALAWLPYQFYPWVWLWRW